MYYVLWALLNVFIFLIFSISLFYIHSNSIIYYYNLCFEIEKSSKAYSRQLLNELEMAC